MNGEAQVIPVFLIRHDKRFLPGGLIIFRKKFRQFFVLPKAGFRLKVTQALIRQNALGGQILCQTILYFFRPVVPIRVPFRRKIGGIFQQRIRLPRPPGDEFRRKPLTETLFEIPPHYRFGEAAAEPLFQKALLHFPPGIGEGKPLKDG
jgi:hypothetical protein